MDAFATRTGGRAHRRWTFRLAALALAGSGLAQGQVVQVPQAHLHHAEGTVAHAPPGEREWQDVQPRRVLQRGDRLWTDRGARAELQAGGHALRMDGQTQLTLDNVAATATQVSLVQGSLAATVTGLQPGDAFEVGTPNLAFRARAEGDYRIDVDAKQGTTRISVLTGRGVAYGEKGEALEVRAGQRVTFRHRDLARVAGAFVATDDFDRWAAARRRDAPTVRMPQLAQPAPGPAPSTQLVHRGPDLVIAGPASALPGARQSPGQPVAAAPVVPPAAAKAQLLPPVPQGAALPAAAPLRVQAQAMPAMREEEQRRAQAVHQAQEARRLAAAQRAEETRRTATAKKAEEARRALAARKVQEARQVAAAKKLEEARRVAAAKKVEETRKLAAAKKADEERKLAAARKAEDARKLAAARQAEEARLAQERRQQLARLQEQARREEQSVQARREEQRRREEQAWREERARREEQLRREETARREETTRLRAVADQVRRDQERRDQEVWLRQQQPAAPSRPAPMGVPLGVPARRVS